MKQIILLFIGILSLVNYCQGQEKMTESDSWIPMEMKGELLHVEKYSEISSDESIDIITKRTSKIKRDDCIANIFAYNLVFRRKINNEIDMVFDEFSLDNIRTASTRDISENLDNNIRFVLKAEYSSEDMVKDKYYTSEYYIFDQKENIRYRSFTSLEIFLKSLKSFNWYAENRITTETLQGTVDDYIERNLPKERKPLMTRSTRNTILGTIVVIGINVLAYLVSN